MMLQVLPRSSAQARSKRSHQKPRQLPAPSLSPGRCWCAPGLISRTRSEACCALSGVRKRVGSFTSRADEIIDGELDAAPETRVIAEALIKGALTLVYEMSYYALLAVLAFAGFGRLTSLFAIAWMAVSSYRSSRRASFTTIPCHSRGNSLSKRSVCHFSSGSCFRNRPTSLVAAWSLSRSDRRDHWGRIYSAGRSTALFHPARCPPCSGGYPNAEVRVGHAIGRFGERLGDASYMLYLYHMPLMTVLSGFVPARSPSLALWLGGVSASVATSLLLAQADLSMHRWLKGRIAVAPARRTRVIAVGFIAAFIGVAVYAEVHTRAQRAAYSHAVGILTNAEPSTSPSIFAEVDAIHRLPDGTLVVRGYAIDLIKPYLASRTVQSCKRAVSSRWSVPGAFGRARQKAGQAGPCQRSLRLCLDGPEGRRMLVWQARYPRRAGRWQDDCSSNPAASSALRLTKEPPRHCPG